MKRKICILFSALMIASSFVACSSSNKDESSILSTPNPTVTPEVTPEITPEITPEVSMMDYDLEDYVKSVKDVYDSDYIPDKEFTEEEIKSKLDLNSDMYDEIYAEGSSLSENPDAFIAVKAKKGMADEVEEKLEDYKRTLLENTDYEANLDKINASKVYKNGDYVFFMLLGANEFVDTGEDVMDGFKNEIQKGVDALEDMFK